MEIVAGSDNMIAGSRNRVVINVYMRVILEHVADELDNTFAKAVVKIATKETDKRNVNEHIAVVSFWQRELDIKPTNLEKVHTE